MALDRLWQRALCLRSKAHGVDLLRKGISDLDQEAKEERTGFRSTLLSSCSLLSRFDINSRAHVHGGIVPSSPSNHEHTRDDPIARVVPGTEPGDYMVHVAVLAVLVVDVDGDVDGDGDAPTSYLPHRMYHHGTGQAEVCCHPSAGDLEIEAHVLTPCRSSMRRLSRRPRATSKFLPADTRTPVSISAADKYVDTAALSRTRPSH